MLFYLVAFFVLSFVTNPEVTAETIIIRAFGSLAILMLHLILVIGPLTRLNTRFLPLLYNRRHLGVAMFLAALIHGVFAIIQNHALGTVNPIYSIFTSNMDYSSLTNFPFQVLGFLALLLLFVMASTSHDFFLKNLSTKIWKRLHMMVYLVYALIKIDGFVGNQNDGWLAVCQANEIEESRAKIFTVGDERVAIFKDKGKLSAVHNVCKHQGGPLGEGKIVDGCITCPWHGYQYLAHNGQSPPPFTEKIKTYKLKIMNNTVYINPEAFAEGTEVTPISC